MQSKGWLLGLLWVGESSVSELWGNCRSRVLLPGELASMLPVQGCRQHEVLRAVSWDRHQLSYVSVFQGMYFFVVVVHNSRQS